MPGGFHPFHPGHKSLYDWAVEKFGQDNVYVAATNDTTSRPFPFDIKQKLAAMAGVPANRFIQVKSPFNALAYKNLIGDAAQTALVFVRSEKDKTSHPLPDQIRKSDGNMGYLISYKGNDDLETADTHGYLAYGPTINFDFSGMSIKSASELRAAWPKMSDEDKHKAAKLLYGNGHDVAVQLLDKALGGAVEDASLEEENLTELFDKPYPYTLDIGSDKATALISLPDGTKLRVGFLKSKTKWDMSFDRDDTFDADDQGDQFKVMATVVAVFKEFVEKVKPAKITFDADKDSTNSRVDVYAKLLNRYADKMGYGFTAKNPEGDSIIQYTLTKGQPNVKNTVPQPKAVSTTKTTTDSPITPTNFSIKKLAGSMWDEFRIFNLHKAGKLDLVDAIAKLSLEDQEWAKLRWGQGLRLGQIGKKYNLDNIQSIQKYKLIHDKIRQNLGLPAPTTEELTELLDPRSNKNFEQLDNYENYEIFRTKKKFKDQYFIAQAIHPRTRKIVAKASDPSRNGAEAKLHAEIDKLSTERKRVTGNATVDFNVEFARQILSEPGETFFAKIVAGPKLVIAGSEMLEYPDIMKDEGFKSSAIRNVNSPEGTTRLPSIPLSSKQAVVADVVANGRYIVGNQSTDKDGNLVFDLKFDSEVYDKGDKVRIKKPALTIGTNRNEGFSEDVSPEDEDKFHNELDNLVHKYFGDSPDEEKMLKKYKKTVEEAPPGREKQVKALKKEFPNDEGAPYAIAWAQHNKKKKKTNETLDRQARKILGEGREYQFYLELSEAPLGNVVNKIKTGLAKMPKQAAAKATGLIKKIPKSAWPIAAGVVIAMAGADPAAAGDLSTLAEKDLSTLAAGLERLEQLARELGPTSRERAQAAAAAAADAAQGGANAAQGAVEITRDQLKSLHRELGGGTAPTLTNLIQNNVDIDAVKNLLTRFGITDSIKIEQALQQIDGNNLKPMVDWLGRNR